MSTHNLNKREKSMIALLGVLLVIYAYFFLVHQPVSRDLENLNAQIESTQTEIETLQAHQMELKKMKEELAATTQVPIPDFDNLQDLIIFLHAIMPVSSEYDIRYEDPVPVSEGSSILSRKLSVSFIAPSYETARHILEQLEASPFRCQVDNLNFMSDDESPITSGSLSVSMDVNFYEYKEAIAAPVVEEAAE